MESGPRRVVTGHDSDGKSGIVSDERLQGVKADGPEPQRVLFATWRTTARPADEGGGSDATGFEPSASEFRVVEMPPGHRREMHRTDTVDYGLVLAGEIYLVLERAETLLRAGDVVVQRGTLHAWHNRSDRVARMAFVNLKGQVDERARRDHGAGAL